MEDRNLINVYPGLFRRIQAVFFDSILVTVAVFTILIIFAELEVEPSWLKVIFVISLVFILEPFLVSITGGTIGHHLFKIRIRRTNIDKRLNIFLAIVRFIAKFALGGASLLAMLVSKRSQALHDIIANSVVVYKSLEGIPEHELISERTQVDEKKNFASKGRRIGIIIIYWLISAAILNVVMFTLLSSNCMVNEICSESEELIAGVFALLWIILLCVIAILGWIGKLYGCRKA